MPKLESCGMHGQQLFKLQPECQCEWPVQKCVSVQPNHDEQKRRVLCRRRHVELQRRVRGDTCNKRFVPLRAFTECVQALSSGMHRSLVSTLQFERHALRRPEWYGGGQLHRGVQRHLSALAAATVAAGTSLSSSETSAATTEAAIRAALPASVSVPTAAVVSALVQLPPFRRQRSL